MVMVFDVAGSASIKKQKATPAPQGSTLSNMRQHTSSKGGNPSVL